MIKINIFILHNFMLVGGGGAFVVFYSEFSNVIKIGWVSYTLIIKFYFIWFYVFFVLFLQILRKFLKIYPA